MKTKNAHREKIKLQNRTAVRASISFPPNVYENLEEIAKKKKVSIAWVVRDAAEKYVTEQWPLFGQHLEP